MGFFSFKWSRNAFQVLGSNRFELKLGFCTVWFVMYKTCKGQLCTVNGPKDVSLCYCAQCWGVRCVLEAQSVPVPHVAQRSSVFLLQGSIYVTAGGVKCC